MKFCFLIYICLIFWICFLKLSENEFEDSEEKVEELGKETQEEDDVADVQSQNEKLDDDGQELKEEALISELGGIFYLSPFIWITRIWSFLLSY